MPSLKEIGKTALTTGLEVLQGVAKGESIKTAAKKRLKENSLAFLDDTVSGIAPRKSIKGSTSKQIAISSSKPNSIRPGGGLGSEARMTKLTAVNQKPITLWCQNLVTFTFYP